MSDQNSQFLSEALFYKLTTKDADDALAVAGRYKVQDSIECSTKWRIDVGLSLEAGRRRVA
jgi:hypothetical protein